MSRKLIFFLMIALGIGIGLYLGWGLAPNLTGGSSLKDLRDDFKADYVLMTAEVYDRDGDIKLAADRLDQLKSGSALDVAANAITYARSAGYSINDLELMSSLIQALQDINTTAGGGS